jgi:hypothetical protein
MIDAADSADHNVGDEENNELPNKNVDNNNATTMSQTTKTLISNPGIAERLEKDISCFESYGFQFQRGVEGNGVFVSQMERPNPSDKNTIRLQIQVSNVALMASIGPYLRTLVRLCIDPIDPRSLHATVIIAAECTTKKAGDVTRSVAHAIHMLIRNSMGAALFVNLHVVLPPGTTTTTSREQVLTRMKQNNDGCYEYPSVTLHDADSDGLLLLLAGDKEPFSIDLGLIQESKGAPPSIGKPLSLECLKHFDPEKQYLALKVSTRMCTVRLTPLLYNLSQRLLGNARSSSVPKIDSIQAKTTHPVIMVCLEKVSNLYRVLMLVRDYGGVDAIGRQLVVVCRSNAVQRFHSEAKTFISKNFWKQAEQASESCFPRVLSIEHAKDFLVQDILPAAPVVGFDLHEDAMTLSEDDDAAKTMLGSAGAVLLGYESDGLPDLIDAVVTQYVQIESRTSINVVAAFSIVLHTVMNWNR